MARPRMGRTLSRLPRRFAAASTLACLFLATIAMATPVAARDYTITLFGSRGGGWGLSNTSLTSPGPPLLVEVGDNVTLNLTSTDAFAHRWFIDYNNNSAADASEPRSPNFGTGMRWNFTVSNQTGTFVYRSDRTAGAGDDLAMMWGNITIRNATSGPVFGETVALAIVGIIIVVVAIAALATILRRSRVPPPPPQE